MSKRGSVFKWAAFLVFLGSLYGCAGNRKALEEQVVSQNDTIAELQKTNVDLQTKIAEKEKETAQAQQTAQQRAAQKPSTNLEGIRKSFEDRLHGTGVIVRVKGDGVALSFDSSRLFAPGQFALRPEAKTLLHKVADAVKTQAPNATVRVEGHTDNQPVKKLKTRFKSNWELSAARASTVLHYLVGQGHMDPKRVYMAGFGQYQPVANNSTPAGRMKNRRVEIVVSPHESK